MVDLLGLGDEVIPESARPAQEEAQDEQHTVSLGTTNEEGLLKLTLKNQGVVFENDILQIGIKVIKSVFDGVFPLSSQWLTLSGTLGLFEKKTRTRGSERCFSHCSLIPFVPRSRLSSGRVSGE